MSGFTGKILRIDLTAGQVSTIATADYEQWGGGHGIGSAIFFDLVKDKTIDGFDPANVVTIMTSPLTGTLAPGGGARMEVQGIGVQSHPIGWFTRSSFGGRFGAMLKYAGWDGIVIQGKAPKPVWVDIRNDSVELQDASGLWGLDTWQTQEDIWAQVGSDYGSSWIAVGPDDPGARTTQRPAVLCIGPAGENLCRVATLVHDAGTSAGQGGFGGVWGAKNLKAISVIGTGSVPVADPAGLIEARRWAMDTYAFKFSPDAKTQDASAVKFSQAPVPYGITWQRQDQARPHSCVGCHAGCNSRNASGFGNESVCIESQVYTLFDLKRHSGLVVRSLAELLYKKGMSFFGDGVYMYLGRETDAAYRATDLLQKLGINACEMRLGLIYLRDLYKLGVLGPGKDIDCDLPFHRLGEYDFFEQLLTMIATRQGIGDDMAEGFYRAAQRWGRLEQDLATGLLPYSIWGLPDHTVFDPRVQAEWGYASILGDRDVNEHDFDYFFFYTYLTMPFGKEPAVSAGDAVRIIADMMDLSDHDPAMFDFSDEGIYSGAMARLVAWFRHHTRFWTQSALYCDVLFPDFINLNTADRKGLTGPGEALFYNAVTGKSLTFADGIVTGQKIWNLDNAIWALQGRHRDMVRFAGYVYNVPFTLANGYYLPALVEGQWQYVDQQGRALDEQKFEQWKTAYYTVEGWNTATGWPTRATLESLGLAAVADELDAAAAAAVAKKEGGRV